MDQITLYLIRMLLFVFTLIFLQWFFKQSLSPLINFICIVGAVLAVFPTVWFGRRMLDNSPTPDRVEWVTTLIHAVLMVLFGIAIIKAVQTGSTWRGVLLSIPRTIGIVLVYLTGTITLLTVINLALRGLGAPFAIALSRKLATDWKYSWTRKWKLDF